MQKGCVHFIVNWNYTKFDLFKLKICIVIFLSYLTFMGVLKGF